MADEKTFTQADIDAAIAKEVGGLKEQLTQVMDEAKEAKRKLRAVCMAQYMPSNAYPFHEDFAKWVLKDLGRSA